MGLFAFGMRTLQKFEDEGSRLIYINYRSYVKYINYLNQVNIMDPISNPYAPGAGCPPPELAGRGAVRKDVTICIERLRRARPAKSVVMVGLRGAGKTVLLNKMRMDAEATGAQYDQDRSSRRSFPSGTYCSPVKARPVAIEQDRGSKGLRHEGSQGLAGFARRLKLKSYAIEVVLDYDFVSGLPDKGELEADLAALS